MAASTPRSEVHCNCLGVLADNDFTFTRKYAAFRETAGSYIANDCEKLFPKGQDYHLSLIHI